MARWTGPFAAVDSRAGRVFVLRKAEKNYAGDAEAFYLASFFEEFIHRLLIDAGHGADFLADICAGADEHGIDEAGNA